ncbi:RNA methyltransferase [bacterium]|nr:RNA methyltransferase [bacterium]
MAKVKRKSTSDLIISRPTEKERNEKKISVTILLDNVRSARNVGLIFRLADCVNVKEVWMCGITPYPGFTEHATNQINKTGVGGSVETVPWKHFDKALDALNEAKRKGLHIICYEQAKGSSKWPVKLKKYNLLLVFGHEIKDVSDCFIENNDEVIELPIRGITNSLNVALCASAVLYEILNQFDDAG